MIWCRDLQYFDSIAIRVSAIGKGAAARHVQRGCMKYHSHLEQPFIFSLAIGDLKAQMAEAGFGNAPRMFRYRNAGHGEFEELKPAAWKAKHDEFSAAPFKPEPHRKFGIVLIPSVSCKNFAVEMRHVEGRQTRQVASGYPDVMKRDDHQDRLPYLHVRNQSNEKSCNE